MPPTTTIHTGSDLVTLINVFTVAPENQQQVLDLLQEATDHIAKMPGFVSASFHRSLDGTQVANYAQWESAEALQAMLTDPSAQPHLEAIQAIATVAPNLYEVVSVHHRP